MACQIQTDKYNSVVLNLIKLDPSVYNNFDNAAKFILGSSLTPEQKMRSIHEMAYIYKGLSGIDDKFYVPGIADTVITAVHKQKDTDDYISYVSETLGLKKPSKLKIEGISNAINAIGTKKNITRQDLVSPEGILTSIKNYFSVTSFPTNEERESLINDLQKDLTDAINDHTSAQAHKDFLIKQVEFELNNLRRTSTFVALSEIASLADLNTVLVTLKNGQMVEAIRENEEFKMINEDNTVTTINPLDVLSAKDARVADKFKGNSGEQVFLPHTIFSSFTVKAIDSADQFELDKKLSKMKNAQAGIKIHAVKLSDVADRRVQRIQEVAGENPKYAGLKNRQHETFENATQTAALLSSSNKKVMTVSRPKASEQQFVLVGEIIGSGEKFYIYSSDNFVFVNSDNSTERVDFTKPEHQELIKSLAVKYTPSGNVSLKDSEIKKLAASSKIYQEFKSKLSDSLTSQFNAGANSVDVTNEFFNTYDAGGKRNNVGTNKRLKDAIATNPALVKKLTVATMIDGKVAKEEVLDIPFVYNRKGTKEQGYVYELRNVLSSDQVIIENGTQYSHRSYAENVLGVYEDKVYGTIVKPEHGNQNNIILYFKENAPIAYMAVSPIQQMEDKAEFAKFIVELANMLVNERATVAHGNTYGKNYYTFKHWNTSKVYGGTRNKQTALFVNFATSSNNKNENYGNLQVEIRPALSNVAGREYAFMEDKEYKNQFNFPINEETIQKLARSLRGEGPGVKKVLEAYPSLKTLNLNDVKDLKTFYDAVETLSQSETALPAIKELANSIEENQKAFAELLITSVTDKLEDRTRMIPQFMELMKRDYTWNGVFNPALLVSDLTPDGRLISRIESSKNKEAFYKNTFETLKVVESDYKRFTIVPKSAVPSIVENAVLAPLAIEERVHQQGNLSISEEQTDDLPDIEVFSLAEDKGIVVETDQERLSSVEWLKQSLPQFGIDTKGLSELIALSQLDGSVLGAFKDKVIYLNDALKGKGVVYHEAFHGVFRHLLSAEERAELIKAVTDNKKNAGQFTEAALKEFARKRNYTFELETLKNLQAEEILADGFQNYMLKNTKPKGIIGQLMALLKKLIAMFSEKGSYIDNVYGKIKTGQYKNEVVKSGIFEGQTAYVLIPGIREIRNDSGVVGEATSTLSSSDQNQLINMIAGRIIQDDVNETFSDKYDRIAKAILEGTYNIDVLLANNADMIASDPGLKDRIIKTMGPLYTNYRFMLGARMNGEALYDINNVGDTKFDNRSSAKNIVNGEDNNQGKVSYEMLKQLVKDHIEKINSILDGSERSSDKSILDNEVSGKNENIMADEDAELDDETSEASDYDSSFNEINPIESLPRHIRKFLTIVQYDQVHPQLGIKVPRMIAGEQLFNTLLQVSSDIAPKNIISHINLVADQMMEDGYTEMGEQIKAVYKKLEAYTNMVDGKEPTTNKQLYNAIVDVLHKTAVNYVMIKPKTSIETIDPISGETSFQTTGFTIVDEVFRQDVDNKKKDFLTSIIKTYKENVSNPDSAYIKNVNELMRLSKVMLRNFILDDVTNQNAQLERYTNELHTAFAGVGLSFPKSLIRMSIMAIDQVDNNVTLNVKGNAETHYNNHKRFIAEKKYLERDFFESVTQIFDNVIQGISTNSFSEMLDNSNSNNKGINRFNTILKKASEYIAKYDPSNIIPTLRNAEGKPIYRYVSNTPVSILAQSIREKGLLATLEEDPFYKDFLESYYANNAALKDLLKGEDTDMSRKVKLFLDNFEVSLFGGVAQSVGQKVKDGKSFKNLDKRTLYISSYLEFLKRTTHTSFKKQLDEEGNVKDVVTSIQTYQRSFSQLEASQTNFLVTGLYSPFANSKGIVKDSKGHLKIVKTLEDVIKQEYARIQNEWARSEENKKLFDAGTQAPIVNNYNGILSKEDPSKAITDDVTELRAYKFNKLADFFAEYPGLEYSTDAASKGLVNFAQDKTLSYDQLDEDFRNNLLEKLNEFAQKQLDKHIAVLENIKMINKGFSLRYNKEGQPITQGSGENAVQQKYTFYESAFLPSKLTVDNKKEFTLAQLYKNTPENYNTLKNKVVNVDLEGLIADYFFNNWMNALYFNEIVDGDYAMNVKDATDYFKRNKKLLAAGSTMKEGYHRVAFLNTIKGFISDKYPNMGPYYSAQEIEQDSKIQSEELRKELLLEFGTKDLMRDIFDGQSITTLMHQIDMHDSMGRITPKLLKILIAKHYRALTEKEVRTLEAGKIVNNPKKTITASRSSYHKQSENLIDRLDVSILAPKPGQTVKQAHEALHGLYMTLYSLRAERQELIANKQNGLLEDHDKTIEKTVESIHEYFKPLPHRKVLHDILNSMEYHQIDQLMDTTASKNATRLPVDYFTEAEKINSGAKYISLNVSAMDIDNQYKFLQVETSGVKDKAKFSVQSKALIAANLRDLDQYLNAKGISLTGTEVQALAKIGDTLVEYQSSLKEIGKSNLATLRTVLRQGGDFEVGKIFEIIRTSLEEQGAPTSSLKLFDLDASGNPVHSANLPGIRNMLEYYFFSQYSKHVTDEKGSGFKNIHISSFGWNVLQDESGKAIFTEEYLKNPTSYGNVSDRPLGITVEEVNGVKTYFVEAIMPKPTFKSKAHEKFYMDNLIKMFGVRIPTEDKRSMVAIKVVDFMDSSNLNGIILPHFVHLLAGSDFDVDALYGQTFAHYFDLSGNPKLYGQYDNGKNTNMNKFAEFVQYMSKDADIRPLIKKEIKSLLENNSYNVTENTLNVLYHSGFDESDFNGAMNFAELKADYDNLVIDIEELMEIRDEAKEEFIDAIRRNEVDPSDKGALNDRLSLGQEVGEYNEELEQKRTQRNEYGREISRAKRFTYAGLKTAAALQVFSKIGLPANAQTFEANPDYAMSVRPIFQNKNLQAKLDIVSNEVVHNHLYKNERSSIDRFVQITNTFGINLDDYSVRYNMFTSDAVIASKIDTSMFKDGIGITANINKFLALASQYGLELKPDNVVWKYKTSDLEQVNLNKFGSLNADNERVIAVIGNILGMFADGAKKPIPAALQMNEVNTGVTLAMIGVGHSPEFAIGFNFIPELRNAVQAVQSAKSAISESLSTNFTYLSKEIGNQIKNITDANKDALTNLKNAGLIDPKSNPYKIIINKENLIIDFKANKLDATALANNTLRADQIGFNVSAVDAKVEFTNEEQKIILLQLYKEQANQTYDIRKAGSIIDLFKKLNPSFVNFDRLLTNVRVLKDNESIFTSESTERIFDDNQIWPELLEGIEDLNTQASKIFLERTEFFAPIKQAFDTIFMDKANIAKIITSYVALKQYQKLMPGSRKTGTSMDTLIAQDDKNLTDVFTPEFWFTNTLPEELEEMQKKYPGNKFLQLLRPDVTDNKAFLTTGGYVNERGIKMINKAKISGKLADEISDDALFLLRNENLFTKKLFYHELAKTGLQYKPGSFLQYLDPGMMTPLSGYINDFIQRLEDTKGDRYQLISTVKDLIGKEATEKDVYDFFDELFLQMAYGAMKEVGNSNIKIAAGFSTSPMSNIMMSLNVDPETKNPTKAAIVKDILERFSGQKLASATTLKLKEKEGTTNVEEIIFNMDVPKDIPAATKETMQEIGKKVSITFDNYTGKYNFPLMISVGFNKYLLNGVDNEIENHSFGKSVINSIVGKGEYVSQGFTARYTLIPEQLTTGSLSSIGFTKEAAKTYMDYVSGKKKLEYIAPKFEKAKETVAKLPGSEQKQTVTKSQLQVDMENLNLTDSVIEALYSQTSKRMSIDQFKVEVQKTIANLRAVKTNEEIIEKIKCL